MVFVACCAPRCWISCTRITSAWRERRDYAIVALKHGLRNAIGPLITQFGLDLAYLLGRVVVVESVFAWPGVGKLAFDAISNDDINVVMGTVLFSAVFVVLANIVGDVAQAWMDPGIRLG